MVILFFLIIFEFGLFVQHHVPLPCKMGLILYIHWPLVRYYLEALGPNYVLLSNSHDWRLVQYAIC